jgi:hypothetical protein
MAADPEPVDLRVCRSLDGSVDRHSLFAETRAQETDRPATVDHYHRLVVPSGKPSPEGASRPLAERFIPPADALALRLAADTMAILDLDQLTRTVEFHVENVLLGVVSSHRRAIVSRQRAGH